MHLAITDPTLALLVVFLGFLLIYTEFSRPGLFLPGALGASLVIVGSTSLQKFPITWSGFALLLASMLCYACEAKFATHGLLTIVGAILMAIGCVWLIDAGNDAANPAIPIRPTVAIAISVPFAAISSFLFSVGYRARRVKYSTGRNGMIGQEGIATGALNPAGLVRIRGEYWNARAQQPVAPGERVQVSGYDGLTVLVKAAKQERNHDAN